MTDEERHEEESEESFAELVSVQGEMNAQVIAGLLESEGVEVMMRSHQTFSALPFTVDGMGAVRIMIRREDLEKAKRILEEYRHDEDEDNPVLGKILSDWEPPEGPPR